MEAAHAPSLGAYLTDGARLGQVLGLTKEGDFELDDCYAPVGEERTITVSPPDLIRHWLTPEAWSRRREAAGG